MIDPIGAGPFVGRGVPAAYEGLPAATPRRVRERLQPFFAADPDFATTLRLQLDLARAEILGRGPGLALKNGGFATDTSLTQRPRPGGARPASVGQL